MVKIGKNKINKLHLLISLIQSHPLGHNHGQGQAYENTNLGGNEIQNKPEPLLCHP